MRPYRKTYPLAKIKHRQQHRLRNVCAKKHAAVIELADDSIRGKRLYFLDLRRFNAKSKRFNAQNSDFLDIQGIHRKKIGAAWSIPTLRLSISTVISAACPQPLQ